MSGRWEESRRINRFRGAKNVFPSYVVPAVFNRSPCNEIDPTAKHLAQFILYPHKTHERVSCFGGESHQDVNIALRVEILAQYRAEQAQFRDLPALAEGGNFVPGRIHARFDDIVRLHEYSLCPTAIFPIIRLVQSN